MNIRQIRGWMARFFGMLNRGRREREFAEELESHLAFHIEDNLRAGLRTFLPSPMKNTLRQLKEQWAL